MADLGMEPLTEPVSARSLLRRPGAEYALVEPFAPAPAPLPAEVTRQVAIEAHYEGYIAKQRQQVERAQRLEGRPIPDAIDYAAVRGLGSEARDRLIRQRPSTVGQAARIAGVTPADVSVLLVYLERTRWRSPSLPSGAPDDDGEQP
jgi:tRNA uridine 5-carboxymethylaminomethyl modification enzyme